jgi:hypothetical protein
LSPDTPHSIQHFFLVADYVSHLENILYPGIVSVKAQSTFSVGARFQPICHLN